MDILLVGAGLSCSVIARELAEHHHVVTIIDKQSHVAGNCYSERDPESGIMIHKYGPHIFHTNNKRVWDYVNRFSEMVPYANRVKAISNDQVYSLPINLHTINQFFGVQLTPEEAKVFIESKADLSIDTPQSFEEQALRFVGEELYNAFFAGYTHKQWGIEPSELPANILKRLPVRFNYDDNYFSDRYQGMPKNGYTEMVEGILDHPSITVYLNTPYSPEMRDQYDHIFWSGPLDAWFDYEYGRLDYRTLDFEIVRGSGDMQGNAVINYCDTKKPYTRISEHKHFAPWETHDQSVCIKEYSRFCREDDIPYYPIRLVNGQRRLQKYLNQALKDDKVTFVGRLGTYRYLDMDVTIKEALEVSDAVKKALKNSTMIKPFYIDPI